MGNVETVSCYSSLTGHAACPAMRHAPAGHDSRAAIANEMPYRLVPLPVGGKYERASAQNNSLLANYIELSKSIQFLRRIRFHDVS